ncbi:hypothetical protein, partial [Thermus scotoductus]
MRSDALKTALRRLVEALWPELAHRTHLPHKARVLRVHSQAGVAWTSISPSGLRRTQVSVSFCTRYSPGSTWPTAFPSVRR